MAVVYSTFTQDFSYTVEIKKNLESIRLTEKYLKVLLILNNCLTSIRFLKSVLQSFCENLFRE